MEETRGSDGKVKDKWWPERLMRTASRGYTDYFSSIVDMKKEERTDELAKTRQLLTRIQRLFRPDDLCVATIQSMLDDMETMHQAWMARLAN